MARIRSNDSVAAIETRNKSQIGLNSKISPEDSSVPRILILPDNTCEDARIITVEQNRVLVCPTTGIYEFKKIAAPPSTPRSFLLSSPSAEGLDEEIITSDISLGYVVQNASFFIATAIDPLFLMLPALAPLPVTKTANKLKNLYLSMEDYLTRLTEVSPQLNLVYHMKSVKNSLEQRIAVVCDTVEAGDETMYRFNEGKLLNELLKKAKRMTTAGLPSSMEEKLVRKVLEAPVLGVKRENNKIHELAQTEQNLSSPPLQTSKETETTDFSSSSDKSIIFSSEGFGAVTSSGEITFQGDAKLITAPQEVISLLRLRVALSFILSSYIPPHICDHLQGLISSSTTIDFKPLDDYLVHLANLRHVALSTRSMNDFSRKRTLADDAEAGSRPGKRQRETEGKKKKMASASRGVKALEKVNVSGMKKMSHFFAKK
ncbi:hypothetical protein K3495_g3731 [Podosphaera aphanis]|nr:hypothetical protein K3495_g3731 [Podosphaera aphanis]